MSTHREDRTSTLAMDCRDWMKHAATSPARPRRERRSLPPAALRIPAAGPDSRTGRGEAKWPHPPQTIVATTAGRIRGFTRNGVFVFKGVPYDATTAGESVPAAEACQPWTGSSHAGVGPGLAARAARRLGEPGGAVPLSVGRRVRR